MLTGVTNLNKTLPYDAYKLLVIECSENGATTGTEQLPERIEATKMNAQRMKRIDKTQQIHEKISTLVKNNDLKWKWVVLAESWCGDGAQNIPIISKIAALAPHAIELQLILRDEHPEIMDQYLTNGSRAIPKLICMDSETGKEIGTWGPRPIKIQQMVTDLKAANPTVSHDELVRNIHLWYAQDKGEALQEELEQLLLKWIG
ncbi:MAG: thioredoxin family protein [Bacteroidia bacterium]